MADLRIVDAPVLLQESITDDVKMPTGGLGNFSIRLGDIVRYVVKKEQLASKNYVDGKDGNLSTLTTSELVSIASNAAVGTIYRTHGFYKVGDCLPTDFILNYITGNELFTNIGNGISIGDDASVKVSSTKKLNIIANDTIFLSQLGGVKTATATNIKNDIIASAILKNFKELVIDGFYTLRGTIWHDKNNVIRGIGKTISGIRQGDGVNKYPIQSIYSDIKQEVRLNERLEMYGFTLDGNNSKNNVRDYSRDINLTYWGFGVALFNINELYVHDMHVKNTEAWGISYHLCNVVHGENITFDQAKGVGTNKDGITGSGKRVTYRNISGYTADDLCAASCGKSTLAGNNCGITVNQEIEYVKINGVEGLEKDGQGTHYAVGIYGPDNAKIKNLVIENVYGSFYDGILRIANYWFISSNLNIDNIEISNISKSKLQNTRKNNVFFNYVNSKKIVIDGVHYYKDGDVSDAKGGNIIQLRYCNVGTLVSKNIIAEQLNSEQNISIVLTGSSSVDAFVFENIKGISDTVFPQDDTYTTGCFFLIEDYLKKAKYVSISNCDIGFFKLQGLMANINTIGRDIGVDSLNIDSIKIPDNYPYLLSAGTGVVITTYKAAIKDSCIILDIEAKITVSKAGDMVCFLFGDRFKFNKHTILQYQPKVASNGANLCFESSHTAITLINPELIGVGTGTYRTFLSMVIPII